MTFGSHGGEDHYVITDDEEVERLLVRDVSEAERPVFRSELTAAAPYEHQSTVRARIHLAMLYLADGDLAALRRARELADADWRDLFMQAEYPSTPPHGTEESPAEKLARQKRDVGSMAAWRNRPSGPDSDA